MDASLFQQELVLFSFSYFFSFLTNHLSSKKTFFVFLWVEIPKKKPCVLYMMSLSIQYEFQAFSSKPETKMIKVNKNLICILSQNEKKTAIFSFTYSKPQFFVTKLLCYLLWIYHLNFIQIGQKMQKLVTWGG